jgi:hypothetical protein
MERPTVEIYLSSEHATKKTEFVDHCTWELERSIEVPDSTAMYVRVISFICPISWFVVSVHYNTILINGSTFILEEGDYSVKQLCTTLSALVPGIRFDFSTTSKKVRMTSATPTSLDGTLLTLLGIAPGTGLTLQTKHCCDLTGNNAVTIDSSFSSAFPNIDARPFGSSGLLTRIASGQSTGGVIRFENFSGRDGLLITDPCLSSITLMLTDEDARPLRATLDYDITLQVQFVRSYDTRMRELLPTTLQA